MLGLTLTPVATRRAAKLCHSGCAWQFRLRALPARLFSYIVTSSLAGSSVSSHASNAAPLFFRLLWFCWFLVEGSRFKLVRVQT